MRPLLIQNSPIIDMTRHRRHNVKHYARGQLCVSSETTQGLDSFSQVSPCDQCVPGHSTHSLVQLPK
jgi:hypothetical protein